MIVINAYGNEDVLNHVDAERLEPKADEILVKVDIGGYSVRRRKDPRIRHTSRVCLL